MFVWCWYKTQTNKQTKKQTNTDTQEHKFLLTESKYVCVCLFDADIKKHVIYMDTYMIQDYLHNYMKLT